MADDIPQPKPIRTDVPSVRDMQTGELSYGENIKYEPEGKAAAFLKAYRAGQENRYGNLHDDSPAPQAPSNDLGPHAALQVAKRNLYLKGKKTDPYGMVVDDEDEKPAKSFSSRSNKAPPRAQSKARTKSKKR